MAPDAPDQRLPVLCDLLQAVADHDGVVWPGEEPLQLLPGDPPVQGEVRGVPALAQAGPELGQLVVELRQGGGGQVI